MTTKEEIKNLETMLTLKTLLDHDPALKVRVKESLERLLLRDFIEENIKQEVEKRLAEAKNQILLLPPAATKALEMPKTENRQPVLIVSSLHLAESFSYLARQPEESLHFSTGIKIDNLRTVQTLIPVGLEQATVVSAEATDPEVARVLAALEGLGHYLTGVFHIHPSSGIESTQPSGVDRAYMDRLSGRTLVFGIWARDAVLRLMTVPADQEIQIFGEGVKDIGKERNARIYELQVKRECPVGYYSRPAQRVVVGRKLG